MKKNIPASKVHKFADHEVITYPNPLRAAVRRVDGNAVEDPVARAEQALAGLASEFPDWMAAECDRLVAAFATLNEGGFSKPAQTEFFRAAHDIKGDAATFGFPIAGIIAESLCRLIEHAPDLATVPSSLLAHHVTAIRAVVRELAEGHGSRTASDLARHLRGLADDYLTKANHDRPEHLEAVLAPSIIPG